jgi:hypothetical protein
VAVVSGDLFEVIDDSYFVDAGGVGPAFAYAVSDNCIFGGANITLKRSSPMSAVTITPGSAFINGTCQPFTGGSFPMYPTVEVSLPTLTPPFQIVTQ